MVIAGESVHNKRPSGIISGGLNWRARQAFGPHPAHAHRAAAQVGPVVRGGSWAGAFPKQSLAAGAWPGDLVTWPGNVVTWPTGSVWAWEALLLLEVAPANSSIVPAKGSVSSVGHGAAAASLRPAVAREAHRVGTAALLFESRPRIVALTAAGSCLRTDTVRLVCCWLEAQRGHTPHNCWMRRVVTWQSTSARTMG